MPPQRKNEVKRLLLNITRYFLPILFVSYLVSFTFFAHVHVVNGVTIVHSHPFKKGAAHKHSTVELLLIQTVRLLFLLFPFLFLSYCICCSAVHRMLTITVRIMG